MKVGYFLSCEEFGPADLVDQAVRAERAGFHALWISDHYHPWNDAQGHSGFVWSMIGAISQVTDLRVTTGVTCPTIRIHPAIVAQAAATSAVLLPGGFSLGVGSGEALNEHVLGVGTGLALNENDLGDRWPEVDVRLEMLVEAVEVIRLLWQGGQQSRHGRHYTVENARVYDLPPTPPPILVSGFGPKAIEVAARIGDGFVTTSPDADAITRYRAGAGKGPVHAGTKVCFMDDADEARRTVHRLWPNAALPGELAQVLPTPAHFEQACELVEPEMLVTPVGPDIDAHAASLQAYADAGVDELYVQQIGPRQGAFFETWAPAVLPRFADG